MISRRHFLSGLAAGVTVAPLVRTASAAPHGAQVFRAGDGRLTALLDGWFDLEPSLVVGATSDQVAAAQVEAMRPASPVRNPVNAFSLTRNGRSILIDTGSGPLMGPSGGHLGASLEQASVQGAEIDAILLTHMHPDHIGGLLDGGESRFANAELVVDARELAFWTDTAIAGAAPEFLRPFFAAAQAVVSAFGDRVRPFEPGAEVMPGIHSVDLAGHTPGHTGFLVDGARPVLIWGDVVHSVALQVPNPDWGIAFDVDGEQARQTRRRTFERVASENLLVAGMHAEFPGLGTLQHRDQTFAWVAASWDFEA